MLTGLLVACLAVSNVQAVDIAVVWSPGTYVFIHRSTNELHFSGHQQIFELSGELRLSISDKGSGTTHYAMSLQTKHASVDGETLQQDLPAIPEIAITIDSEGRVVEFDTATPKGFGARQHVALERQFSQMVLNRSGLRQFSVLPNQQWSQQIGDNSVHWTLANINSIANIAEVNFRYFGPIVQIPESRLFKATGLELSAKRKNMLGRLRLDLLNNRMLGFDTRAMVELDIKAPGDIFFEDVKMITTEHVELIEYYSEVR